MTACLIRKDTILKKLICLVCGCKFNEDELEEPFGLSGMALGCPSCGSDDLGDYEDGE